MIVDLVTVPHTDAYVDMAGELWESIVEAHPGDDDWTFEVVDNRIQNRGFAKGCNVGAARQSGGIVGLLNPDTVVEGPFLNPVRQAIAAGAHITGTNFGKPVEEWRDVWGCQAWVCGAAFFVARPWWEKLRGFDTRYVWSWEETDFIRRSQLKGGVVTPIELPLRHDSPDDDNETTSAYKQRHFARGSRLFYQRWSEA